jgi:hypothetical protein
MSAAQNKDGIPGDGRTEEPVGQVEFDSRGKAIWRWARDKLDSTTILLKRLENQNLALEPTQKVPVIGKPPAAGAKPASAAKRAPLEVEPADRSGGARGRDAFGRPKKRDGGGGFDPHNSR